MFGWFKRRVLPRELRPAFSRDERVLAWAMTPADSPVIATNLGLWWDGERRPWHEIAKAVWDGTALTVTLSATVEAREGYSVVEDLAPVRLELREPGRLPHQVRLRVTSSVAHRERFASGWIAARRVPGVDGLSWIARHDPGVVAAEHAAETDAAFQETYWKIVTGPE